MISITNKYKTFVISGYEPVSEDSDNEKGDKRKSFSNSRSVGESASPASNNCETQTFPVDDLSFQTEIMASETPIPPKTVTNWDKFRLLMWKNYLIQWRHKWRLIFEIFLPVAMILFIVYVRSTIEIKKIENPRKFRSFDIDNLPLLRYLLFTLFTEEVNIDSEQLFLNFSVIFVRNRTSVSLLNEPMCVCA